MWPDPGLSRNTRRLCYRCSVPGLAGFTRQALCGARDLIKTLARRFKNLDFGFAMREHSQQAVDQKVRQRVRDYGYNDRK
jgi:hypothetical protein